MTHRQNNRHALPDVSAAAERLADIAFELRERGADAALCDALDAAVREICTACGSDAKTKKIENRAARGSAYVLSRPAWLRTMPSMWIRQSSGEAFDMPLQDSAKFAAAAAALAASLSALNEEAQAPSEPQDTSSVAAAIPPHDYAAVSAPQPARDSGETRSALAHRSARLRVSSAAARSKRP